MSEHYLSEAEERWLDKEEQNLIRRRNNEKQTMIGPTDSKAINQFLESALTTPPVKASEFTKVDTRKFATLTITDHEGYTLGSVAGEMTRGGALATHLRDAYEEKWPEVRKLENSLTPLGQDIYDVDRDFMLEIYGLWKKWDDAATLRATIPLECRCTFTIYY